MGILSSIVDSFTGKSAQKALDAGYAKSSAALAASKEAAKPYYDQSTSVYDDFLKQGTDANALYSDILAGGPGAETAFENYRDNPFFTGARELGLKRLDRFNNAKGLGNSGANYAAQAQAANEYADQYLGRLKGEADQGFAAAGGKSNALARAGDFEYGFGRDQANNDMQYYTGTAANSNTLANNIIGLTGAIAGGVGAAGSLGWKPLASTVAGAAGGKRYP